MGSTTPTPYWNANLPISSHTSQCPPALDLLNPKDIAILSTPEASYTPLTWPEVQSLVATNRLDVFQRSPLELRRYLEYTWSLKRDYGSVMAFILNHKLGWEGKTMGTGEADFEKEGSWKVLWNDWPYGIDERVVHLVVWTKFVLEDDPKTDDLTDDARAAIQAFVDKTFVQRVGKDNVIWFKNWKSLKSVHAVEHFHVMMFDPEPEFLREITGQEGPLSRQV